jgi:hypothetical protein
VHSSCTLSCNNLHLISACEQRFSGTVRPCEWHCAERRRLDEELHRRAHGVLWTCGDHPGELAARGSPCRRSASAGPLYSEPMFYFTKRH